MAPKLRALVGAIIWTAVAAWRVPNLYDEAWARVILLFVPLVLLPFALDLVDDEADATRPRVWLWGRRLQLPAALFLVIAFQLPPGRWSAAMALPWVIFTGVAAGVGLRGWGAGGWRRRDVLCRQAALVYLGVGGLWVLADRLGLRPLRLDPAIVLLTAVHFHYAGFVLPTVGGQVVRERTGALSAGAALGVVAGVPLVAAGITVTQLTGGPYLEFLGSWVLALSAAGIAGQLFALARQPRWPWLVRGLWMIAAAALGAAMVLAALYASRWHFRPWAWLDLPWMRVLHGTANMFGFGLAGVVGWWLARDFLRARRREANES